MSQKKDIKLVKKLLKNDTKCLLYTEAEIHYMEMWLQREKDARKLRKMKKKSNKGFGNE